MSPSFKHILIPVDFSKKNDDALGTARDLAQSHNARVTILHVIEKVEHDEDPQIQRFYDELEVKAESSMREMAKRLSKSDLEVQREVVFGRRGREIVQYTMDHEIDLVVLSSHKVNLEFTARDWDTLSYQVSVLCPCSVLLVK